jgi:hypothetical protein
VKEWQKVCMAGFFFQGSFCCKMKPGTAGNSHAEQKSDKGQHNEAFRDFCGALLMVQVIFHLLLYLTQIYVFI